MSTEDDDQGSAAGESGVVPKLGTGSMALSMTRSSIEIAKTRASSPLHRVWDSLWYARKFIERAAQGGIAPDLPAGPCMEIAAGWLWSAVDIFNRQKLANEGDELGKNPTQWFTAHEVLVHQIRNGAVHYLTREGEGPTGVGTRILARVGEAVTESVFVWVERDDGSREEIPMADALSRLTAVLEKIKTHVRETQGELEGFSW